MQLIEVSTKTGYAWFRQGIWLFRRNPLAFITLFFTYLFAMTLISFVPIVGTLLPFIVIPGTAVGFMAACRDGVAGKPIMPTILLDGFRKYGSIVTRRLFMLGGLYLIAIALVFLSSVLVDDGTLFKLMFNAGAEKIEPKTLAASNTPLALLAACIVYIPVAMLFWFAPVLIAWHNVPPIKALFFSMISCWRNRGAFVLYGLLWFATAFGVSLGLSLLLQALNARTYAFAAMMPASIIITTMLYCSFYATYRGCFGVQELE